MATDKPDAPDIDLSMLSEEEREALAFLDTDEGQAAAESDIGAPLAAPPPAVVDPPVSQQQPAVPPAPVVAEATPPVAQQPAGQGQAPMAPAQAPVQQPPQAQAIPVAPVAFPKFAAPANADALREQLDTRENKLVEDFDNGELTAEEYRTQLREVTQQRQQLDQRMMLATISEEARKQSYQQTVETFLAQNPQYQQGSREYMFLDTELRRLQTEASMSGGDPLNPALLLQAHGTMAQLFGWAGAPKSVTPPAPQSPAPGITLPPPPGHVIPPAFHQVPTSSNTEITDPVASALGGLTGEAFEDAFARLPAETREKFLDRLQ